MTWYLNPKTGATQGNPEGHGTQAEPFMVPMAWQASTLSFVALQLDGSGNLQTAGGGGGGGGAVTVADGADVAQGTTTDAAVTTDVAGTLSAKLRGLVKILGSVWDSVGGRLKVDGSGVTQPVSLAASVAVTGPLTDTQLRASAVPVSGTFFQATQPVSIAATVGVSGPLTDTQLRASAVPVSGTFFQATQPISGTVTANQGGSPWAQNLTQYGGVAVGAANAVHVQPGTGATFAVSGSLGRSWTLASGTDTVTVAQATAANLNATITGTVAVSSSVPGTGVTNLGKAEDAAHTSGDTGVFVLSVRNDTLATLTSADGDYSPFAVDTAGRTMARETPTTSVGTTISGANATVTLTVAAAGAGIFHYITGIEIVNVNPTATAIAGSAVTLAYTTTNLPGSLAWTAGNALAAGVEKIITRMNWSQPIKSSAANTATTIVAPAIGAGGLCRITAYYYTAP